MCVGCKGEWKENDRCTDPNDAGARPAWLPAYTSDCRIKKCPACHMYIEHESACNHMTCKYCRHEFCFVCMLPWEGFHDPQGCPSYQDPDVGYDDEGYENNARGLHRDTGLNRAGRNRKGELPSAEQARNFGETYWEYDDGYSDYSTDRDEYAYEPREHYRPYDDYHEYEGVETGPIVHIDPEELAEQEYRDQLDATVPRGYRYYDGGPPIKEAGLTWDRIECGHSRFCRGDSDQCSICRYWMPRYYFKCTVCELVVCEYCTESFQYRVNYYAPWASSMVGVIQWAEEGEVPFRTRQKEHYRALREADAVPIWSVSLMFQQHEKELYEVQPFLYFGYGIAEMVDEYEKEAREEEWFVVEDDVGLPGNAMTFRLDTNPFAPLFWELE